MREDVSWAVKADFVRQLARRGERADGRPLNEYRPIEIITDYIPHSAGSALVKIGKTQVIAGVSLQAGTPYPDTPDSGVLMTGAELIPLASPEFEPGPPSPQAVELARVVDRGIRESHVIDFDKLCIEAKKAVWMVMLDLHVIDYDGNLFDAGTLASTAALLNTKMLKYEDGAVVKEKTKTKLPMKGKPVECTFAKIGETLMLDPDIGEEHALDARLTLATIDDMFCAAQKGGFGSLTQQDIESAMDLALKKGAELRKLL